MTARSRALRWGAKLALLAMVAVALPASAAPVQATPEMLELLGAFRSQSGAPGAGLTFGDGEHEATLSSGTGTVLANDPIASADKIRVGSNTKMFVSVVVLQLVDEGRLELDVPLEQYLPGVLRYPADKVPGDPAAYDGRAVTLRHLLQHTSGVGDYADYVYVLNPLHQIVAPTDQDHLAHALPNGPSFRPGTGWQYSNTGFILLGMAVQAVTGRSIGAEIAERIVEPLGLPNTFFAGSGQRILPGAHVRGYVTRLVPVDITELEPAVYGAAGALVSTPDDMNTFLAALLAGKLLSPARLAEMQDEVPYLGGGYGLGLVRVALSCGDAWGHSGFVPGYQTIGLARPGGRRAFLTLNTSLAVNLIPPSPPASAYDLFELALC